MGVNGIIIPQIKSSEEAKKAVEYSFYPPFGKEVLVAQLELKIMDLVLKNI